MPTDYKSRLVKTIAINPESGCWLWTKSRNVLGYGCFYMNGRSIGAHRASYILHVGPIPEGLWVLHKCDNSSCINPEHLFLGTRQDNINDMVAKGRHKTGDKHSNWKGGVSKEKDYHKKWYLTNREKELVKRKERYEANR